MKQITHGFCSRFPGFKFCIKTIIIRNNAITIEEQQYEICKAHLE